MSDFIDYISGNKKISDYKLMKKFKNYKINQKGGVKPNPDSEVDVNDLVATEGAVATEQDERLDVGNDEKMPDFNELPADNGEWKTGQPLIEVSDMGTNEIGENKQLEYMDPTAPTLYTIPSGTILYHGTMIKETFDPARIVLGNDTLVAFFSPNKKFAMDYISSCSLHPEHTGYIHKFIVTKDIGKIFIISPYDKTTDWELKKIENKYCNSSGTSERYNGVGFFVPYSTDQNGGADEEEQNEEVKENDENIEENNEEEFQTPVNGIISAEFALCNPKEWLEYIETERCVSVRSMSKPYSFNK